MAKLSEMGHGEMVKRLKYSENVVELRSALREYVFGSDAKVNAFLKGIQDEVQGQASGLVNHMLDTPRKKCPNCGYELKESHVCRR